MIKPVEPEVETLGQFLNAFNGESDRGAALTAAAILDEKLAEILKSMSRKDIV